jgi:ankyrin repeat protein
MSSNPPLAALKAAVLPMLPGIVTVLAAVFFDHPSVLILLLLAQAPLAAGAAQSLGYQLDQGFVALMLRRGLLLLISVALYAAWVAIVIGTPALRLLNHGSMLNAVLLSLGFLLALVALIRLWPVFGLCLLWDDAYPESARGSWIVTASRRIVSFAWHLTGDVHEHSFGSGILVTFALLLLIVPALSIAGLCGTLPSELHDAAVWVYALVCCPLAHLLVIWRTERLLLSDEDGEPVDADSAHADAAPAAVAAVPAPLVDHAERDATLLNAAASGNVAQALALLADGADPNVLPGRNDRDQRSPLMSAVCHSDLGLLRALIERGANPNLVVGGVTPLLLACRDTLVGRPDAVMMLLANGADVARIGPDGSTALHHAAITRDPGIAAMLLDAGAAIDAINAEHLTPLGVAVRAGNEPVARLLLDRGAACDVPRAVPALIAIAAAAEDHPQLCKRLLKSRADVHAADKLGRTALHVAALHAHGEMVEVLIGAGADVDARDRHGVTPLMEAARAGANRALQRLVFRKPDTTCRDGNGRTALHLACQSRQANADTIGALLGLGADVEARSHDGKRPVDIAAAAGRWQMVQLLDPQWPVPAAVGSGETAAASALGESERLRLIAEALRCGRMPIARELLELEPPIEAPVLAALIPACLERDQAAGLSLLLQSGLPLESVESPLLVAIRHTPLPLACIGAVLDAGAAPGGGALLPMLAGVDADDDAGRRDEIEALALAMLERGADPFGSDSQGRGLLHHAVLAPWPRLLAFGLARGLDANVRDARGNTPLHLLLMRRHPDAAAMLRQLIRHGADPMRAAGDGQTVLGLALQSGHHDLAAWLRWSHWPLPARPLREADVADAARFGDLEAVRRMVQLGLPLDGRDAQGCTPLLRAAGGGHAALVEWLIAQGADTGAAARTGATPLSAAVSARQEAVVARLIAAGATVDQTLPGGITSLMIAAALGFDAIVQMLLVRGADASFRDELGNTALHAAVQFAWASTEAEPARRIIERLLDAGVPVNAQNHEGSSALLLLLGARADAGTPASNRALGALVSLLLARGADIDVQDRRGVSVLHSAAMHGMLDLTAQLLKAGADVRRTDTLGRTAHEVAVLLGYVDLAARLKRA